MTSWSTCDLSATLRPPEARNRKTLSWRKPCGFLKNTGAADNVTSGAQSVSNSVPTRSGALVGFAGSIASWRSTSSRRASRLLAAHLAAAAAPGRPLEGTGSRSARFRSRPWPDLGLRRRTRPRLDEPDYLLALDATPPAPPQSHDPPPPPGRATRLICPRKPGRNLATVDRTIRSTRTPGPPARLAPSSRSSPTSSSSSPSR